MNGRTKAILALVAAGSLAAVAGMAIGAGGDDAEAPIGGDALDRASAAALTHLGGGRVTDTEVGDEEGYYEVEVTLDDGSQVDVHLDQGFNVIGQQAEGGEGADDE